MFLSDYTVYLMLVSKNLLGEKRLYNNYMLTLTLVVHRVMEMQTLTALGSLLADVYHVLNVCMLLLWKSRPWLVVAISREVMQNMF